jgi:hypothetical protein
MAYVAQLLGYDSSVQSAAFDYLNAPSNVFANPDFSSNTATTISYTSYTNSTLAVKSPAGYYSNGVISRYYDGNETLSAAILCEYTLYVSGCCSQGIFELSSNSPILLGSILNLNTGNFCYTAIPTPPIGTVIFPLNVYGGFTVLSPNSDCNDITCQDCPPPPCFGTCDVIFMDNPQTSNLVYGYNYASNISVSLNQYFDVPPPFSSDIAHTDNKLWVYLGIGSNILKEYDITLCPFSAVLNRTISLPYPLGAGLTAIDDVTLISSDFLTNNIVEIDISGPIATGTIKFPMPTGRYIAGDMVYTYSVPNKLICTYYDSPYTNTYITQHDYNTGVVEVDVIISPTVQTPYGMFITSGNLYVCNSGGQLYNFELNPPHNLTYVKTTTNTIGGASQPPECADTIINQTIPPTATPTPTPTITPTPGLSPTPTPTPGLSPTPTPTPTTPILPPFPSPPNLFPGDTANNCTPITILPLGIDCVTLVAPTQNYLYGSLSVNVTGGTAPYIVSWKSPNDVISYGNTISNAFVGDYVVTVVDYWRDLTATTTCSLTYTNDCTFSGSVINYTPPSPSQNSSYYNVQITGGTSTGGYSIYYEVVGNANYATNLTTGLPASGITLTQLNDNVGINVEVPDSTTVIILYNELCDTYQEFSVTSNNPINDCLCISIQETYTNTYNQIEVCYTGDTLNGKPLYTNGVESVSWNTNGYWELNGYADPNGTLIRSGDFDNVPDTNWFALGLYSSYYTITTTDGVCVASPPVPSLSAYGEEITCNTLFGNIVANAIWGTPPWMYSLDGITYSNTTGVFTNVGVGLYTVYAMDGLGVVLSTPVTVPSYAQPLINVIVNTQFTQIASVGNMDYYKVDFTYDTSTLPIGLTFNADYILNYNLSYTEPGLVTFDTTLHTLKLNGVLQTINNTSSIALSPVGSSSCNPLYDIYGGTEQYSSLSISIENSDIVEGTIIVGININSVGVLVSPCITSAQVDIQALLNVTYLENPNCYSINAQQINQSIISTFKGTKG